MTKSKTFDINRNDDNDDDDDEQEKKNRTIVGDFNIDYNNWTISAKRWWLRYSDVSWDKNSKHQKNLKIKEETKNETKTEKK